MACKRRRLSASAIDERPGARDVTHSISQRPGPVASGRNLTAGSSTEEISHHFITHLQTLRAAGDSPRQPRSESRSAAERRPRKEHPALLRRSEKIGFFNQIKEKSIPM